MTAVVSAEPDSSRGDPGERRRPLVWMYMVFFPDSSGASQLWSGLFAGLARGGLDVTALCGFPAKDVVVDMASLTRTDTYRGVKIVRCGLRIEGKRNLVARALGYLSFLVHAGWKIISMGRTHRIVGGTDPPFTPIVLWFLSLVARFEYELVLTDIYPDGLVGIGKLSESSPLTRLWRGLNRLSYKRARRITVIGRDMVTRLDEWYGMDPARIVYIPHWGTPEVDVMEQTSGHGLLGELGLEGKFVVQYSGNMGLWHDMDSLVQAAARLRGESRIHFLFVGKGMRRRSAELQSKELGLSNMTWLDFLPPEQLAAGLSSCDAALISFRGGLEGVAVPSKLYGILSSGKPVIAQVPLASEIGYVVNEEQCGIVVEPNDVDGLVEAIQQLSNDASKVQQMGVNARRAYKQKYTLDRAARSFKALWEQP